MREQILGLTTPLLAMVFAIGFLALWRRGGMGDYVLAFAVSYFLFAIGFFVTHLSPTNSPYTFHATQLFYAAGAATLVWGACDRVGRRAHLGTLATVYGVAASTLLVAVFLSQEAGPRLLIVNTGYGVMFVIGIVTLLGVPRRDLFDRLVIAILAINAIDFLVRPMITLLIEGSIDVAMYRQSIYYSVINLVLSTKALATGIVLFGACMHDLIADLRERSDRDLLTGLRNRRAFQDEVDLVLDRARDGEVPVSLLVADIDHFKQVNDIWGHQAGDQAIAAFGKLIGRTVRGSDVTGRIGGEEFCILVWNCTEVEAERLAERIRIAFAQMSHKDIGADISLTASFGVTQWQSGEPYRKLFGRADAALYTAKESGRNCTVRAAERGDAKDNGSNPDDTDDQATLAAAG